MKRNYISILIVTLFLSESLFAAPCQVPAGNQRIDVGALKENELLPTISYSCDDKGDRNVGGSSICVQTVFCVYMHSGGKSACEPDSVQGSVFRMSPTGEVLDRYGINVDKIAGSVGKPLYGSSSPEFIKRAFCGRTWEVGNVEGMPEGSVRRSSRRRFKCLCEGKFCSAKESRDLDLYSATIESKSRPSVGSDTAELIKANVDELVFGGASQALYTRLTVEQSNRTLDILNGVIPASSCKANYQTRMEGGILGYFQTAKKVKVGTICSTVAGKDFVLMPDEFTTGVSKIVSDPKNEDAFRAGSTVTVASQFIQAARKSMGGCYPTKATARSSGNPGFQYQVPESETGTGTR